MTVYFRTTEQLLQQLREHNRRMRQPIGEPVSLRKPQLYGIWHGGDGSYSPPGPEHLERFTSRRAARLALNDRYSNGYWDLQEFDYVTTGRASNLTPLVGEDCYIDLFDRDPREHPDDQPIERLQLHRCFDCHKPEPDCNCSFLAPPPAHITGPVVLADLLANSPWVRR